jgi:hypothetical protein
MPARWRRASASGAGPSRCRAILAVFSALALAVGAAPAAAQRRQPDSMFSVDADWLGATVGYARARAPGRYGGVEAGLGGSFLNRMLLAGEGYVDEELVEMLHVAAFRRWTPSPHLSWDLGVRTSLFVRQDSWGDDSRFPLFAGLYASLMAGTRRVKVGPRVLVGVFPAISGTGLGVYLVPVSGRISFGW